MADSSPPAGIVRAAGIVLAAGSGVRFGGPKAPFLFDGERLVDRSVSLLRESGLDPVVVVLGAWVGEVTGADTVVNKDFTTGLSGSLAVGLNYLQSHYPEISTAIITLVDLPFLQSSTITHVAESNYELAQAHYRGEPGHPVKIAARYWNDLLTSVTGDSGAKSFLRNNNAKIIEIDDPGIVKDLDQLPG